MEKPPQSYWPAVAAAWCGYVVADFIVHAVVLAAWWRATASYWLPPRDLFRRIPLGYAAFLIYCIVLVWLFLRLQAERISVTSGLRFGAAAGLLFGTISILGTYSALRMPIASFAVWPISQTIASAAAGGAAAWVCRAGKPWRRMGLVAAACAAVFVGGVVVQSIFLHSSAAP